MSLFPSPKPTQETRELDELKRQLYEKNNELTRISNAINELCPTIVFSGRKLLDVDAEVNEKLLALKEVKAKREAHLRQLVASARALDRDLGGERLVLGGRLLSLDDLSQNHIDQVTETIRNLTQTKSDRQRQLVEAIPQIVALCNELGEPLPPAVEAAVTSPRDSDGAVSAAKLSVTEEAMAAVAKAHNALRELRAQRVHANTELAERLLAVGKELPGKAAEIERFVEETTLVRASSRGILEEKLAELATLRREHLRKELAGYRAGIADLWAANDTPQAERVLPKIRPEAEAGDDAAEVEIALSQYREVYERLEAVRREREPIVQLIKTREETVKQRDALEASTRDPAKYSSRSAADAAKVREEAELKSKIDRRLPAVEKRLDELLRQWHENHGERFVYEGVDYLVKIKTDNENYKKHIEELKKLKKTQRLASSSSAALHRNQFLSSAAAAAAAASAKSARVLTADHGITPAAVPAITPKAEKRKIDNILEKSGASPIPRKVPAKEPAPTGSTETNNK